MKKKISTIVALLLCMIISLSAIVVSAESYVQLYAEDGRTKWFPSSQVAAQLTVGWYKEPVQRLYADGKSKVFPKSQVAAQLTVGWYTYPVQRLYAPGKSKIFPKSQVAAQLTVGWYTEPFVKMYALDGRSKYVAPNQVAANESVGWFTEADYNLVKQGYWKTSENLLDKNEFNSSSLSIYQKSSWTTNINTTVKGYIYCFNDEGYVEYYLGGKYSDLTGVFAVCSHTGVLNCSYRVKIITDNKVVYTSGTFDTNSYPTNFKINLKGCTKLRIEFEGMSGNTTGFYSDHSLFRLGNLKLYKWVK